MTAHAGVHSAALTRYLRLATLGLLGEQRQAAQDELEEHLLTRADHLHAFGLPYDQALSQALRDMGSPLLVSAGMLRVHTMPKPCQRPRGPGPQRHAAAPGAGHHRVPPRAA
ncbi:permease prefix domain 1-containing protein [Deinococcus radiophilus]|uniref:Uncharacterized protein n=1 Tax=Deinococcus radiophilus TaxID=32062 RepID=A0A431VQE1_9DEIO|nr:permease prefix domain 1-containing protein [Deinococcus radiophilus]RTR25342.1 hypothetical protein EJ104_11320 [Deinococcus radiophilus]UFA50488.1 permease prefix domain 1-containing protein [Deinococcus radiophilus]